VPSLKTARQVSRLFFTNSEEISSDSAKPPVPTIEAAVNLRIKAHEGACVPADQTILYSWSPHNKSLVSVFENSILYTTSNISHVGVFGAAKSVNWTRKIDGVTFWQNMTIIFQGNSFISLKCFNGEWREVVHKEIANVFPGVAHRALDSVLIRNIDADQMADLATVYMFFGHEYYECSVTGNDPCEGPYSLMSEFFNVDHYCLDSTIGRAESQRRFLVTGLIFASIILFALIVVLAMLYFTLKPEHFTYFVNRKMNRDNRDNLSYEALKLQNDGNTAGQVETKSVTNGKS